MNQKKDDTFEIINTKSELEKLIELLERESVVGVDLEADSMYHFKEKVCLVQMATQNVSTVIDPLMVKDLSPLKNFFKTTKIKKIFHGADYDVRSLFRDFNITINNLFDTELAARFLGLKETGLQAVLRNKYAVSLDKRYQRKDWSKRPLPDEMLAYAAKDVRYLIPLATSFEEELSQKGRLGWVQEECRLLSQVRAPANNGEPLFLSFKGAGKLDPTGLAVLEKLLQLRKKIAAKKDAPLFRVIGNKPLMILSEKKPLSHKQLEKSGALSTRQIDIYGRDVVAQIQKAMKLGQKSLPVYPRRRSPSLSAAVAERVKTLKIWRDKRAEGLKIDPSLICTKLQITLIAMQKPQTMAAIGAIKEIKNWQRKEFGREIIEVIKAGK